MKISVKGRLAANLSYWKSIGANEYILNVLGEGYRFPLISEPSAKFSDNNRSAKSHSEFVGEAIDELLKTNRIKEVYSPPYVVNPLSVSVKGSKKRLILDLRHVNLHVYKTKIKFDDWKTMEEFVDPGGFLFKFDLKQGYHHVDIHPDFQKFLGFSWVVDGVRRYFVFTVLPFGLTSAPYIFTKIVRVLVKFWRSKAVKLCCFIDDGLGTNKGKGITQSQSDLVRYSLKDSGFIVNDQKSVWEVTQVTDWLGVLVDLKGGFFQISGQRESSILHYLDVVASHAPISSARRFSKLTGLLISTKFVLGDIVRLRSRSFYKVINNCTSWDASINFSGFHKVFRDLEFWRSNFSALNRRPILPPCLPSVSVTSDASGVGLAAHTELAGRLLVAYRNFSPEEAGLSSTWRELAAIVFGLRSFQTYLVHSRVSWRTDNYAASIIATAGSRVDSLQSLAEEVADLCTASGVLLEVIWTPRRYIAFADSLSKLPDYDDWETSPGFFEELSALWGPFEVDRFADQDNHKLPVFFSKFHCPGSQGVNAFSVSWAGKFNYLVPPVSMIPRVLRHLEASGGSGVLVAPLWESAAFYPLILSPDGQFKPFVKDYRIYTPDGRVRQGKNRSVFIGSSAFSSLLIGLRLEF